MQRKFYALFFTAIMIAGIASPFVMQSTSAQVSTLQISPSFSIALLTPNTNPNRQNWALLIANSFQTVGIQAQRVIVPWDTIYDRMLTPNASVVGKTHAQGGYDMGFIGYALGPDPDGIYGLFHGSQMAPAGQNYYLWNDSYANSLAYNVTHTIDASQRNAYVLAWQEYAYNQVPSVTIFYTKEVIAFKPSFQTTPFSTYHYPLWPGVEQWNDTTGTGVQNVTLAQTGPVASGGGEGLVPYLTTSYYDLTCYGPIFGELAGFGLFIRNTSFQMVPYMAYGNWTVTNGGRNWTFWIQPGIKFHDGETLDGRDWVYTTRYEMTPGSGSAVSGVYSYVSGIICGSDIPAGIAAGYGNNTIYWAGEAGTPGASLPLNYYEVHVDEYAPWAFTLANLGGQSIIPASVLVNSSGGVPAYNAWDPSNAPQLKLTSFNTGTSDTYVYYSKSGVLQPARSGPIGAGPYQWVGYDTGTFTDHLYKFPDYFNKAALESAGVYKFSHYYVTFINGPTSAIAALSDGSVQVLDSQYHLENSLSALLPSFANYVSYDAYGVQEMGFNMQHPIWGTGVDTPLGQSDPTQAAAAATHVRRALDYLVPKDAIIKNLLNGYGSYGITTAITRVTAGFNFAVVPRNFTYASAVDHAIAEFEAAGYTFGAPTVPTFWEAYGLLIAIVELAVIVVVAGFYFFRPRKL